jgi:uncharacterized protein (TIGR00255 family)
VEDIRQEISEAAQPELFALAEKTLTEALENLTLMRKQEGQALLLDLGKRLANIETGLSKTISMAKNNSQIRLEKLRERIRALIGIKELDPYHLELEVALLADKYDINEELVRLKSHCDQFRSIVETGSPCGRKLDFLIQEMNRELNTTAAKADIADMSHLVVEMKEELERMREQAQNVE